MRRLLLSAFLFAGCGRALPTPTNEPDMASSHPACNALGDPCCFGDGGPHCGAGLACVAEGSLLRCQASRSPDLGHALDLSELPDMIPSPAPCSPGSSEVQDGGCDAGTRPPCPTNHWDDAGVCDGSPCGGQGQPCCENFCSFGVCCSNGICDRAGDCL